MKNHLLFLHESCQLICCRPNSSSKGFFLRLESFLFDPFRPGSVGGFCCHPSFAWPVKVRQFALEPFERQLPVFPLELVVGSNDCYPGWFVEQPNRAFHFISVLSARAASSKRVDFHFPDEAFNVRIVSGHRFARAPWTTGCKVPCRRRYLEEARFPEGVGHRTFRFVLCGVGLRFEVFDFFCFRGFLSVFSHGLHRE